MNGSSSINLENIVSRVQHGGLVDQTYLSFQVHSPQNLLLEVRVLL